MTKKVTKARIKGWVKVKNLIKIVVLKKPQEDCVEVWIEIVPIKRSSTKED